MSGISTISLTIDPAKLAAATAFLVDVPNGIQRAAAWTVNQVVRKVNTRAIRDIAEVLPVKVGELRRKNVRTRKASFQDLEGRVTIAGRRIPLIRFGAKKGDRKSVV